MTRHAFRRARWFLASIIVAGLVLPCLGQEPPPLAPPEGGGEDPPGGSGGGASSITDLTVYDHLSLVARAPGVPEGSVFAGFENSEAVQLFNGNLTIRHPSSPSLPLDGGASFQALL